MAFKNLLMFSSSDKPVRCQDCRHFYITWDKQFPYGCRAMNFKGKNPPSAVVFRASQISCQLFSPKKSAHDRTDHQ